MRDSSHANRHTVFFALGGITQHVFQNAVHDQVGIAPDRRSEMRIRGSGQREVASFFSE